MPRLQDFRLTTKPVGVTHRVTPFLLQMEAKAVVE